MASDEDESSARPPSLIERIDLELLASIATKIHPSKLPCVVDPIYASGSFNVVWFITFNNGDEWVARVPRLRWSPMLERRLRSDMLAYELISKGTSMAIPKIFAFSPVTDNPLGQPYTLMSRMKGKQISSLWFDKSWFTEERRLNFFRSLAENMAQLRQFSFPLIGSFESNDADGGLRVGPLLPSWLDLLSQPNRRTWDLRGPFSSVHELLSFEISRQMCICPKPLLQLYQGVLRLFAGFLPDPSLNQAPFVLEMPDFSYQNILVEDDGTVTGLLDWDELDTVPRQAGYARYPAWITRDFDLSAYGYPTENTDGPIPPREELQEDSPSELQRFRDEYLAAYAAVDPSGAHITRNSHVFHNLCIAIFNWQTASSIIPHLAKYAFGEAGETVLGSWALHEAIKDDAWYKNCIVEAERHAPPSDEDKKQWRAGFEALYGDSESEDPEAEPKE
ncbi:hypothetical protein M413DRAFT_32142 [Hebeloma cylindrosporum]|uniref:Aminoglycoside phosphotransferase domain-containing protein n=1 Tax=Hebeloma cylindrosporum TaxID=76867 RepID=A0A0C3BGQ0_HEBCY|nr:hypothetical protein M413DRAFT_32142 [Hebeloma cylindrosporum h7]